MSEISELISSIESKTEQLLRHVTAIKTQLRYQEQRNADLQQMMGEKDKKIALLEEQISRLQTARPVPSNHSAPSSAQEANAKINDLVREINQCIALLNR
ncbi:MAG TPA: hypothetical protein VFV37_02610 [Luteibaculaceae bacterium]|nr:hypothetical protein [Luteibaculaceae bacterium]